MPRQLTMLRRLLLVHAAAAFPMLGAEIPLGERTKMSWDPPPNGDDGVEHFQLFLPRRWAKDQKKLLSSAVAGPRTWPKSTRELLSNRTSMRR